mgnify:CR=1 FL=1
MLFISLILAEECGVNDPEVRDEVADGIVSTDRLDAVEDIGFPGYTLSGRAISALIGAARTGEVGDGKIFVVAVEKVLRIRTGEEDDAAI